MKKSKSTLKLYFLFPIFFAQNFWEKNKFGDFENLSSTHLSRKNPSGNVLKRDVSEMTEEIQFIEDLRLRFVQVLWDLYQKLVQRNSLVGLFN